MKQNESAVRSTAGGYSSNVQLLLIAGGASHPLAQIGPDSVILREPAEFPPGDAEVLMRVDGNERRWRVCLSHGAVPFDLRVATTDRLSN